jgi:acetylornithine deacetylase/succinyl-diaminopimelate desuccinylase-like protein
VVLGGAIVTAAAVRKPTLGPEDALTRELLAELVAIDTTDVTGNTTLAAEAMARRLLDAGFPEDDVLVLEPQPRKGNLVARLRGSGTGAPILLLAHLDVVDARRSDWSFEPFTLVERDGFYYGRGTTDDKAMAAIWIANFVLMKRQGFIPRRDLIVALTADEEGGDHNGVRWLLANRRELIDAAFCLNEGGGGRLDNGRRLANDVQLSEKMYQSFRLEAKSAGGHSSVPRKDNAIYQLSRALVRIAKLDFPVELDEITRSYFEKTARIESGELAMDLLAVAHGTSVEAAKRLSERPHFNAMLRTTCVATELLAGHAENALPQTARATVNCRILPGSSVGSVQAALEDAVADETIAIVPLLRATPSPPSPLSPEILGAIEQVTQAMWPGVPVIPTMSTGATDGLYLRNAGIPTYGVSGIFQESADMRAHGRDERIAIEALFEAREFLDRLTRTFANRAVHSSSK